MKISDVFGNDGTDCVTCQFFYIQSDLSVPNDANASDMLLPIEQNYFALAELLVHHQRLKFIFCFY